MGSQRAGVIKCFVTVLTLIWLLTCMYEHVLTQVASIVEDLATHITFVLLLTRGMFSHMSII